MRKKHDCSALLKICVCLKMVAAANDKDGDNLF